MSFLLIASGLVLLTVGADFLLRGASTIARRLGLSELLIGLTLVGFGTSTPELVSSLEAARAGAPGIALGNVLGSNIANIFLILGLSALIAPIIVEPRSFRRDAAVLALATIAATAIAFTGAYGRLAGAVFLAALTAYIAFAFWSERKSADAPETIRRESEAADLPTAPENVPLMAVLVLSGFAMLIIGAKMLVTGAVDVATTMGVSETVIGLTVVAVGTSLPELVTSTMAAFRGKSGLALGNVIGSNIYNLLGILGATALVSPLPVDPAILRVDIWVMLGATIALIVFARTSHRVTRTEGSMLVFCYAVYILWLVVSA